MGHPNWLCSVPEITIGGIKFPIAMWSVSVFSMVAIVWASFYGYRSFYPVDPTEVSAAQANHILELETKEYNKHFMETPSVSLDSPDQKIRVFAYDDRCIVISMRSGDVTNTRLLVDPTREDMKHTSSGDLASLLLVETIFAAEQRQPVCLNPHPGDFKWMYGERPQGEQCWIPMIRIWPDGCQHYQMKNTCNNTWDTNRDGSPKIHWTRCVH